MENKLYWLGLSISCPWPRKLKGIVEHLGGPINLWHADFASINKCQMLTEKNIQQFLKNRGKVNLGEEWEKLHKKGISLVTIDEADYPTNLKQIYDPPPVLYIKGNILAQDQLSIGLVGARKATHYGQGIAEKLGYQLTKSGITVVSGLARGIDTWALKGAIKDGGRAIAVLGSGVDIIYPRENKTLARNITENGAIISELPPGTEPRPWHFPLRNRIISGLSLGIVVVEAAENSGSLITADQALEQGREVFAVPGPIYSDMSKGCHNLIKQGAILAGGVEDILTEIGQEDLFSKLEHSNQQLPEKNITPDEAQIFKMLTIEPLSINGIIEKSELAPGQITAILLYLELKGLVQQLPGKRYIRKI